MAVSDTGLGMTLPIEGCGICGVEIVAETSAGIVALVIVTAGGVGLPQDARTIEPRSTTDIANKQG